MTTTRKTLYASTDRPLIGVRDASQEVDSLLCSLHRVATSVHEDIEATRRGPTDRAPHIVDFSQFESRARQIALLCHLHVELQSITAAVAKYGLAAETLHREELEAMQEYIASADSLRHLSRAADQTRQAESPLTTPQNNLITLSEIRGIPWKDRALTAKVLGMPSENKSGADSAAVVSRRPPSPTRPTAPAIHAEHFLRLSRETEITPAVSPRTPILGIPCPPPERGRGIQESRKIFLADQVSLDAIIVPDTIKDPWEVLAAVNTPELYYIPRWDHFAVRVGAVVFHGNIGQIYPTDSGRSQRAPVRVKECRYRGACPSLQGGAPCSYYHDPIEVYARGGIMRHPQDVRNFVADSWVYTPVTSRYSARYGSRRIGSRDALTSDLRDISAADARRYLAQTAHDILCSIVLVKYVLSS